MTGSTAGKAALALVVLPLAALLPSVLRLPSMATAAAARISGAPGSAASAPELVLGQSAPFSGPSAQLGQEYRLGAQAWFAEVNRRGGIHGRRIRLVSHDDRYEPELTRRNTDRLIQQDRVLALFGYVGTPTVKAVLPTVEREHIPLVAPLTGAMLLREPRRPLVFNLRASYQAELDQIVAALVRAGRHRIAVLHQNDAFGDDGLAATRRALQRHGLQPVATAGVERNSSATKAAARTLQAANPSGVVIISSYPGAAAISRDLLTLGSKAQLMTVSFVGSRALQQALPDGQSTGIGISQVVPFPWNRRIPVVAEYQRLMQRQATEPQYGFTSLEGFLAARLISEGLQRAGPIPSRKGLTQALESMGRVDLGGFPLELSPSDRQASDFVELTYLGSQTWEP
ncbi:ABC transporter substrate-binding protein [Synechococcus sp. CCY9202]|uniref:ABC transporter substrate-binding protein n=1 Tax=Synechococcus sp. CCY9202 TaxID=174698 RepID=UPI002B2059A7|nr:ABC transporter substrate-binding protein [Synechococcus sp. CCY9202]MEA5421683.1 ABC transporter substrate-binding protein [Synechococcus sp. CCY9202]